MTQTARSSHLRPGRQPPRRDDAGGARTKMAGFEGVVSTDPGGQRQRRLRRVTAGPFPIRRGPGTDREGEAGHRRFTSLAPARQSAYAVDRPSRGSRAYGAGPPAGTGGAPHLRRLFGRRCSRFTAITSGVGMIADRLAGARERPAPHSGTLLVSAVAGIAASRAHGIQRLPGQSLEGRRRRPRLLPAKRRPLHRHRR